MRNHIQDLFETKKKEYTADESLSVELAYLGAFNQGLVESIADEVERIVSRKEKDKVFIKKIFSIFVEGMNNIRFHGFKGDEDAASGFVILTRREEGFLITVSNSIEHKFVESLKVYLNKLNSATNLELKEMFNERLSKEVTRYRGGSGFGLLTARMKSGHPFKYDFYNCDDHSDLLTIEIVIDRKKNEDIV